MSEIAVCRTPGCKHPAHALEGVNPDCGFCTLKTGIHGPGCFFIEANQMVANLQAELEEARKKLSEKDAVIEKARLALEETLAALVSYKHYIPEPYKQNPIYIIGAHEAEKKALEALAEMDGK